MNKLLLISFIGFTFLMNGCTSEQDKLLAKGEEIYTGNCKVCHSQGINGAPVFGNKKNWASRKGQGIDVLVEHASNGFGLMPAKGGKTHLQEEEIRAAVAYMLSAVEE